MLRFVSLFLCLLLAARALAQAGTPDVSRELQLIESTERGLDPLGLDESTGKQLDLAAERLEAARKQAALTARAAQAPSPVHGEVLSGIEGVQEVAHTVQVRLAEGLAFVHTEIRIESRATQRSEIAYRLPLPAQAASYAVQVCQGSRCTQLAPVSASSDKPRTEGGEAPSAEALSIVDTRGSALGLRAASVQKGTALTLRIDYVAPAEIHAGKARFRLPARGYDPRLTAGEVSIEAPGFVDVNPVSTVALEPNLGLEIQATLDPKGPRRAVVARATRAICGGRPCSRNFDAAPAAPLVQRETWLLLDASPSMEGPARNAADTALVGLLSLLPEETSLRVFAFAARAKELGRFRADAAPLAVLSDALMSDLGGASRPGAALALAKADLARSRPRLLLVSDGKLDKAAIQELVAARRQGAELWWIALGDPPRALAPSCDGVVQMLASLDIERSEERLQAALSPLVVEARPRASERRKAGLRAGEQRVHDSAPNKPYAPLPGEGWLSFWYARERPFEFRSAETPPSAIIRAPAFGDVLLPEKPLDTGMPKESVLSMLRNQLVPQARACLRSDRKGRGDYAVALTFHALFADREAYDVRVEGKLPDALRQCLSEVVPRLRIPAFSGRIRVRYPIHTEREPESPVIELEPDALDQVNRVIRSK